MLDVGCGTGAPACRLARRVRRRVTGITTSAVGVEAGRVRAGAEGVADRVRFEERDGMDNGFPDASFDRTWVLESSHLMRERDRLVAECARVLRPGGRLALCDIVLRRADAVQRGAPAARAAEPVARSLRRGADGAAGDVRGAGREQRPRRRRADGSHGRDPSDVRAMAGERRDAIASRSSSLLGAQAHQASSTPRTSSKGSGTTARSATASSPRPSPDGLRLTR